MDKDQPPITAEHLESQLPPASQSRLTGILNGAGNGAMVGLAVPYAALKSYHYITKKPIPNVETVTTFGSVLGAAIGAMFGIKESKQIENYRQSISTEVSTLHRRVNRANDKITELNRALEAKEQAELAR